MPSASTGKEVCLESFGGVWFSFWVLPQQVRDPGAITGGPLIADFSCTPQTAQAKGASPSGRGYETEPNRTEPNHTEYRTEP